MAYTETTVVLDADDLHEVTGVRIYPSSMNDNGYNALFAVGGVCFQGNRVTAEQLAVYLERIAGAVRNAAAEFVGRAA